MELTVKILQGQEIVVEIPVDGTVADVKDQVLEKIGVAPDQQRIVFKGKALQDHSVLTDCGVVRGSKLFLTIKKTSATSSPVPSKEPTVTKKSCSPLWDEMHKFLKRHFTEGDAKKVLEKMKEGYKARLDSLSLDDIERLAHLNLEARRESGR